MCIRDSHHIALLVLHAAGALDEVGPLQAALGAVGVETLILGNGSLQEVVRLHIEVAGEGDRTGAGLGIVGVVLQMCIRDSLGTTLTC